MADLEQRLRALAADAFPPVPDITAAVAARIAAEGDPTRRAPRLPRARRRAIAAVAVALVLVPAAAIAAVPDARHAVLDWLGIAHVRVERVPGAPDLPGLDLPDLGDRVASAEAAGRRAGFSVAVPRALGVPDAVFVTGDGIVSLAWRPRPGLPRDSSTGLGLVVTELAANGIPAYFAKAAGPGTRVELVRVGGARGVFLSGAAHGFLVERRDGLVDDLPPRLAGNALAFEYGDLVFRVEGRLDRRAALALARSLPPAGR